MIRRVMPKPGSQRFFGRSPRVGLALLLGVAITSSTSPVSAAPDGPRSALPEAIPTLRDQPIAAGPTRWDRDLQRREELLRRNRGRKPAAVLSLLGLLADLQGEIEPTKLESFTRSVAEDRSRHPLVRSYASYLLSRLEESRGDRKAAKQRMQDQGHLISWQIVGPFDNTNRRGESAVYAPQTEPYQADQTFTGKLATEPLGWRPRDYDSIPRGAYVSFDDLLRPNTDVTGYATCWVKVDKDTPAALHMGSGGPYQAWVEGTEVGSGSAYRVSHPLQDSHPVALKKGWNRLLVKVSALDRMWGFHARLSLPSGAPIPGLQAQSNIPRDWSEPTEDTTRPSAPKTIASLRAALEGAYPQRGETRTGPPRAGLDLVAFYRYVRPFDFDESTADELARSVDERVKTAESAWLRAILERDPGESMRSLHRGVDRARAEKAKGSRASSGAGLSLAQMLLELGWRERSLGLEDDYRKRVAEAHDLDPTDAVVELQLVDDLAEQGYAWASLAWLRDLVRRNPHSESLQAELASRLRRQGRPQDALAVLEALAAERGSSTAVVSERIETLLDLGRADDAAALARQSAEASPGLPGAHLQVGRLEEARQRNTAAKAAWAKALALAPHDAALHARFGRLLVRLGEKSAAAASLKRSLALRPQQPNVRDLLASLDTGSASDMFERYGLDFAEIAESKVPSTWAGKDAGMLRHRVAVKVLPNGLTERLDHRIIRVLDDRGIRSQAVQALSFDPAESIVEVRRARVRRADGTIEELGDVQMVALASAGYRMYYDQRQIRVVFGGLRVGDTLEVAFLQRDVAVSNMFEDYFGDLMPVQGIEPRLRVEYILEAPKDKPIFFNRNGVRRSKRGKSVVYRYSADNVLAIKPEGGMPGWTEIAEYLHASTYKTWDDVGKWYWDLVREQLVVDDDIRAAVAEAIKDLPESATEADKVAAIYEYVVRNTRYVGLEFGIHGYKPYRTTEILDRQFGDCKDKASLLKVMLAEVGIDSHLVLVRTRDQGTVPGKPASLSVFNHAITYVPSLDRFLDGTAEWSGPTELPSQDQGASVLIVKDGRGATFRKIPISKANDNVRDTQQVIRLSPNGAATVAHEVEVRGAAASKVRYRFQSKERRDERVAKAFGDLYPGVEVTKTEAPKIGDIQTPPRLVADMTVPQWATPAGKALRFRVLGRNSDLTQSFAGKAEREHDLVLDVPSTERYRLRYRLPAGHEFTQLPEPATIDTDVGRFTLEVNKTADGAEVRSEIQLKRQRIPASQYPAFRDFLRSVDAKLEQDFEISKQR